MRLSRLATSTYHDDMSSTRVQTIGQLALLFGVVGFFGAGPASAAEPTAAPARQMAVTVDDLPVSLTTSQAEQIRITEALVEVLRRHSVPAIGFVNESKLEVDGKVDPARVALLERWLEAGFELGNHGYQHLDLNKVDPESWIEDILRGERVLRPLLGKRGMVPRFFRHPYLHTGRSLEIKRRTTDYLGAHGYRVAPVSVDNQEYRFGRPYAEAESPAERQRIGEAYVEYMDQIVRYYEQQAEVIVGRPIPHVLLIHAYALNADRLGDLLKRLEERGYEFVSLEEALTHPAYESEDTFTGPSGITWLHRRALTSGMPGSTFAGEPDIPQWMR
jgi:peptidoglycan/xylan/chitin deacetylase (PgdA/CDA1 family)